ncbi:glycoside hydrolase family 125 protein [Pedobacter sp. MR2016-24]|uniref:glycoside hydrolase family 125 protein n=1 Tax=Pedobacter sp. MR2016-24 TaxID=2994466 RepID=UPI002246EDAD|nr:glycoside hydrolase family 125 protein [Pedobacter sp. MR2016-24]MCX2485591.1 glycoside hydrolase family 125 protein [Pedobacter sp. MR2016-24]
MKRRSFVQKAGILTAGLLSGRLMALAADPEFPLVRKPLAMRRFNSRSVENAITEFNAKVKNKELGWLFNNCFPNTLDTTVTFTQIDGKPDTYIASGETDAMWLRDSSAQVWSYLPFLRRDRALRDMVAGVINRQVKNILKDPYANAFYNDPLKVGEWKEDLTSMLPGIHERKWEIDSLCYPIRLSYRYWQQTKDTSPFDNGWQDAVKLILKTFKEQQRKENNGPYHFQRTTAWATDNLPMQGFGYPVKPVGLICSAFRPSDDATIYSFLVPSNFFAVISLRQAAELFRLIKADSKVADELEELAMEVRQALQKHAIIDHPVHGKIYAYEVNGMGSYNLMDDANIPGLLALPYLGAVSMTDPVYLNTRKMIHSDDNPFYYKGKAAEGIGGPHIGKDMIWPLSIIARALTSTDDDEIKMCIDVLRKTHADTGFIHESFHKDNPKQFTRAWFPWGNTIFGELLWKTYQERPHLLV